MGIKDYWASVSNNELDEVKMPSQQEMLAQYRHVGGPEEDWRFPAGKYVTGEYFAELKARAFGTSTPPG
ncbi:MAG: hypothetical protein ACP5E4_02040 [Candidatus Aenigmatarchaeota archaeon]